ncbi:hypothetical protein CKA32_000842 [Geitlerinema sp. FC II]|nr:hypothetical protein CKA32_000842 [Geitlerinema sp. FC II]
MPQCLEFCSAGTQGLAEFPKVARECVFDSAGIYLACGCTISQLCAAVQVPDCGKI